MRTLPNKLTLTIMKKFHHLLAIVLLLAGMCSCTRNKGPAESETVLKPKEAACMLLLQHLRFLPDEDIIYLDLQRDEAAALGIADEYYDEMIESIESTNEAIHRSKIENPDAHFHRVLPGQAPKPFSQMPLTRDYDPNNPKSLGGLETYNQSEICRGYWAPHGEQGIRFYCLAKCALLCIHICKTHAFGRRIEESCAGSCIANTILEVDIAASDTSISACYEVSDPYGGRAAMEWL